MTPLTYTTAPPTTPGWYWMRLPTCDWEMSNLFINDEGVPYVFCASFRITAEIHRFPPSTLWAGPIPRPVEA